tara:strand:+ start:3108 stop:3281 length:174 start_codon:yes stop_codon:yes gene_type:complete
VLGDRGLSEKTWYNGWAAVGSGSYKHRGAIRECVVVLVRKTREVHNTVSLTFRGLYI